MSILKKEYWKEVFSPSMIIKTTMQTIIGSMLVGAFFMLFSDFIFKPYDLHGRWELTLQAEKSSSKKLSCVDITYTVLIMQKGVNIIAAGEKIRDSKSKREECKDVLVEERHINIGKGKKIKITGFIQNSYIEEDILTLSYFEGKRDNQRFTIAALTINKDKKIEGWYNSNIGHTEGKISLKRVQ
jgi:hypothetical protein